MKFAYPQNPSAAVSTVRRFDETSDALTQQNDLDRKQSVALIGETVPMVFCDRSDFGNGQGENGGVWVSPKLIQLGLENTRLSMMYLLSQGKITGLEKQNVFWGQQRLEAADDSSQFCHAYEAVPSCLDLDYVPGESLGWVQNYITIGPEGEGTFITEPDCIKITVTWASTINVKGSGALVTGFDGIIGSTETKTIGESYDYVNDVPGNPCLVYDRSISAVRGAVIEGTQYGEFDLEANRTYSNPRETQYYGPMHPYWDHILYRDQATHVNVFSPAKAGCPDILPGDGTTNMGWDTPWNQNPPPGIEQGYNPYLKDNELVTLYWDMRKHHRQASWDQPSEVRFSYEVFNAETLELVAADTIWVRDGSTSWTLDGLEPGQYRVRFFDSYKERNKPYGQIIIPEECSINGDIFFDWYLKDDYPVSGPPSEFMRWTNPGSETIEIASTVTQTIFRELAFPILPGGQQQVAGGLSDLTMAGIEGSILKLRPVTVDQFMQAHVFVEKGIEVNRLLDGVTGSSRYYSDLVNYLMGETKILQTDQIDTESLISAARMNEAYSLFFNGILQTTNSLAEWVTRTAPYFLLTPQQVDGRYGLMPVCPLDGSYQLKQTRIDPTLVITTDQIVDGTYQRVYMSNKDRRPTCLVMVYRDQPSASIGQTVTIEARYPGTALSGPFEQHDLTEFCCRGEHAVYAARYILAKRRHTTHTCNLTIGRDGRSIKPGDIVQVDLDLNSSDGKGITDQTLYQVEGVTEGQGGTVNLDLIHFPVDSDGASLVAKEVHAGAISIS